MPGLRRWLGQLACLRNLRLSQTVGDRLTKSLERLGLNPSDIDTSRSDQVDRSLLFQPIGLHGRKARIGEHSFLRSQEAEIAISTATSHTVDELIAHIGNAIAHGSNFMLPF